MSSLILSLVPQRDGSMALGKDGGILIRSKEDMKQFREYTMGKTLIVGRKTYEGLPKLEGRTMRVLTTKDIPEAIDLDEAKEMLERDDVVVIGGRETYLALQPYVKEIRVTIFAEQEVEYDVYFTRKEYRQQLLNKAVLTRVERHEGEQPFDVMTYRRRESGKLGKR